MTKFLVDFLDITAMTFVLCGVVAIVAGTVYTLYRYFKTAKHEAEITSIDFLRCNIARSIVLGLEFFVAGDIIRTVITPDYYAIGILAILVTIRTVLTYFLNQELESLKQN